MLWHCMQLRVLKLFTQKEHVNSVAPSGADSLWVILHNLGKVRQAGRLHAPATCEHKGWLF